MHSHGRAVLDGLTPVAAVCSPVVMRPAHYTVFSSGRLMPVIRVSTHMRR